MSLSLAYNTSDSPVLAGAEGYVIEGHGWGAVDTGDPICRGEMEAGRLIEADEDQVSGSDNPQAKAAVAALEDRRSRLEQARAMSKADLVEALPAEQLATLPKGKDGRPAKDDLVAAVAAGDKDTTPKPRRGQK